jgi:hypothetical protein
MAPAPAPTERCSSGSATLMSSTIKKVDYLENRLNLCLGLVLSERLREYCKTFTEIIISRSPEGNTVNTMYTYINIKKALAKRLPDFIITFCQIVYSLFGLLFFLAIDIFFGWSLVISVAEPEPQGAAPFGRSRSRNAMRLRRLWLRQLY